jgi:hypothetical protein
VTLIVQISSTLPCPVDGGTGSNKSAKSGKSSNKSEKSSKDGTSGNCTLLIDNSGTIASDETPTPTASNTVTTHVVILGDGRMTGGGTIGDSGSSSSSKSGKSSKSAKSRIGDQLVRHGFTLHCDVRQRPNRLQVNWGRGERFHLEQMTSVSCLDDPTISPRPPAASFDTHRGTGTGRYNGRPATAEWVFTDAGQPGRLDTASIVIRDAGGAIVLSASGLVSNGNHQAH